MWQKYWAIYKHSFIQSLSFRSELILWTILDILPTLIMFLVWQMIFRQQTTFQEYSLSKVVEFYFYFLVINNITSSHFEERCVDEIRQGKIDRFFTRPVSYPMNIFFRNLATKSFYLLLLSPGLLAVLFGAKIFLHISFSPLSATQLIQIALLMCAGFMIEFMIGMLIVLMGFWNDPAGGLEHFKWMIITVLGGTMVPRPFLPHWLKDLVSLFPFQYMYVVPIEIAQGIHTLQISELVYLLGFMLTLGLLCTFFWKKALAHYTSYGG